MATAYPVPELSERASATQGVCLNVTSRKMLCDALDPEDPKDWQRLAELMGFEYQAIRNIARNKSPTQFLLDEWMKKSGSTLGQLISFLSEIERYDLLENEAFFKSLERDAENHFKRQEQIVQDPKVDSTNTSISMDAEMSLTLGGEAFHAFISYADEDWWFVKELLDRLEPPESEGGFGLKICIDIRNLLAGIDYNDEAKVIRQKCRRILLIISPNFLKSPACDFHVKYAHALSPGYQAKKIVSVLLEPTENVQEILLPVLPMKYNRTRMCDFFWNRLGGSLKVPIDLDEESYSQEDSYPVLANSTSPVEQSVSKGNSCSTIETFTENCSLPSAPILNETCFNSSMTTSSCSEASTPLDTSVSSSVVDSSEASRSCPTLDSLETSSFPTQDFATLVEENPDISDSSTDSMSGLEKKKKVPTATLR